MTETASEKLAWTGFVWRIEDCPECGGSGWRRGFRGQDIACHHCDKSGEVEATCVECGKLEPLNDERECSRCHDKHELSIAEFCAKYPVRLTEPVHGDPFLRPRRKAA